MKSYAAVVLMLTVLAACGVDADKSYPSCDQAQARVESLKAEQDVVIGGIVIDESKEDSDKRQQQIDDHDVNIARAIVANETCFDEGEVHTALETLGLL